MSTHRLVITLTLLSATAQARPPAHSRAGGVPACEARLDTCTDDLTQCDADLNAYVDACNTEVDDLEATIARVAVAAPGKGALVASSDGVVTATVSPLAVSVPTTITIDPVYGPPADDRLRTAVYDMGPDGATFDDEVTLCMTLDRTDADRDGDDLCLGFVDEDGQWRCEDACLETSDDGQLCGKTDHFTNFALLLGSGTEGGTCTDDDGDDWISPSIGGIVASRTGAATLRVPAGATPSDTPVRFTIERLKPTGLDPRRVSDVYEFGPDGARFDRPVEICLDATAGSDDTCLGYLDEDGRWRCEDACLEDKGGQVCGETSHFTSFAVLLGGAGGDTCGADTDPNDPRDPTAPSEPAVPSEPATPVPAPAPEPSEPIGR